MNRIPQNKYLNAIVYLSLAMVCIGGCANPSINHVVHQEASRTSSATQIVSLIVNTPTISPETPTLEPLSTSTPTPKPKPEVLLSNWDTLENGEYIAFRTGDIENRTGIDYFSLLTMKTGHLSEIYGFPLTSDGQYIEVDKNSLKNLGIETLDNTLTILDLKASKFVTIFAACEYCSVEAVDQNLQFLLSSCEADGNGGPFIIKAMRVEKSSCDILTPDYESHNAYGNITWSPDGNWIALYELQSMWPKEQVDDGLYIMPATCLENSDICQESMAGPFKVQYTMGSFSIWSKDSRFLAIFTYEEKTVRIFDLESHSVIDTWAIDDPTVELYNVNWLSNGDLIASIRNVDNLASFDLLQYHSDTKQTEILATGLEGPLLFTFTKE